jgi:hypothetical protein
MELALMGANKKTDKNQNNYVGRGENFNGHLSDNLVDYSNLYDGVPCFKEYKLTTEIDEGMIIY